MRRILILDNEFEMGGKEKSLFQFIAHADRTRFHFAVCCLKEGGYFKEKLESLGVPFYDHLLRHRFDALGFVGLERVLRAERTQLVYTFSHPNTVIFSYLARLRGLVERIVVSYHAMGDTGGTRQVVPYLLPLLRRADALLAVAQVQKDYLVEVEGLPRERIQVIHNGVDTKRYRPPAAEERQRIRAELGFGVDDVVLIAVASLKPLKQIDVLLRAAARLSQAGLPVRVVVAGDGSERAALESLAAQLGLAERVWFAGLRDDVERLLQASDVFVLASRTEAFPNVVLEAMATGLPVVTTDVGSVREMVEDGSSATVVPSGDETALATAIARLASDAPERARLGERGRQIVDERFRFESMCAKREALFEALLSSAQPRAVVTPTS
jgi:glycosyltransferase involved in cell wall biosynthesis